MMAARKSVLVEVVRPLRAALYLRVSTGRQAEHDVSLPSQRDLMGRHCQREGWTVVDEYVEPGLTGTDDRRPAFQAMIERACDADHPYDVIVVHAFSRFYRDGAVMELTIRKLRRHGVEVISITQPTGTDPSQEMMRQIIGIFDEYTSRENAKNVMRSMRENARQGFWNGTTPPLGYRIVEAEQRGQKIKKKLEVDPVEEQMVVLIFRLYADGDSTTNTPPLGIKALCHWLNTKGYRTKRGGTFGVGSLHQILTNTSYLGPCSTCRSAGSLKDQLFDRDRLTELLSSLAKRRAARATAVNSRLVSLQAEVTTAEQKLKRLYQSIANGIVELDDLLGEQITILKAQREKAKAALDKAMAQGAGAATIDPEKVESFSRLMTKLLANGETPALKAYLRAILGKVVVGNKTIRVVGSRDVLAGAVMGKNDSRDNVRGYRIGAPDTIRTCDRCLRRGYAPSNRAF